MKDSIRSRRLLKLARWNDQAKETYALYGRIYLQLIKDLHPHLLSGKVDFSTL